jgi:Zn-finger nucleic acid-binding protein
MNCPNDREPLETTTYEAGVEVESCPKCRGIWLHEAELEKIQESKENDYSEELSQIPDPIIQAHQLARAKAEAERECPKCGKTLTKEEYAHCSGITIDVCAGCAGIWLDQGELEALEVFFERAQQEVAEGEAAEAKETRKAALKRAFLASLKFVFRRA